MVSRSGGALLSGKGKGQSRRRLILLLSFGSRRIGKVDCLVRGRARVVVIVVLFFCPLALVGLER